MIYVDPPHGYLYGFPKLVPEGHMNLSWEDKKKWYIKEGYPEDIIEDMGENFYVTYEYKGDY